METNKVTTSKANRNCYCVECTQKRQNKSGHGEEVCHLKHTTDYTDDCECENQFETISNAVIEFPKEIARIADALELIVTELRKRNAP